MLPNFGGQKKYGEHGQGIIRIIEKSKFVREQELTKGSSQISEVEEQTK